MKIVSFVILFVASFFATNLSIAQNEHNTKNDKMKHISKLHDTNKDVSAQLLFNGTEGKVMALQIQKDGLLKEHITKTEALLVCVSGEVVYEDEKGNKYALKTGDFINIEPMVKHWVKGLADSQLLLIK